MMGALGNGRRGGRSPSLLMAALISCILLLAFNYWVSNSRNVELQSKILELEDRIRLLSADREREEQSKLKAEDEMHRQNEQLELMEKTHHRQQENAINSWRQEKENLQLNISSSAKAVQNMKNRMKSLLEDVNKMQSELKSCHSSMDTLTKKANSDKTQCNKEIEATKEECSVKIAAAKQEKLKTAEKVDPQDADGPEQKVLKAKSDVLASNDLNKNPAEPPNGKPDVDSPSNLDAQVETNELVVEKDAKDAVILQDTPIAASKLTNKSETLKKPAFEAVAEAVEDIKEPAPKDAEAVLDEADILEPKENEAGIGDANEEDDVGIGDANQEEDDEDLKLKAGDLKEEDAAVGKEDAIMYDNEGEIEKQLSQIKDENQGAGQDLEDDVANYNGDDENQPESEDEKQAELAGM